MDDKPVFIEKQYLGREWIPVTIRLVLAIFCFAAYTFNFFTNAQDKADILALVGFGIIIISIIMGFLMHFRTRVRLSLGVHASHIQNVENPSCVRSPARPQTVSG